MDMSTSSTTNCFGNDGEHSFHNRSDSSETVTSTGPYKRFKSAADDDSDYEPVPSKKRSRTSTTTRFGKTTKLSQSSVDRSMDTSHGPATNAEVQNMPTKTHIANRPKTRKIIRWTNERDLQLLLHVIDECESHGITIPYDSVAKKVSPDTTAGGVKQHIAKLRGKVNKASEDGASKAATVTATKPCQKDWKPSADDSNPKDKSHRGKRARGTAMVKEHVASRHLATNNALPHAPPTTRARNVTSRKTTSAGCHGSDPLGLAHAPSSTIFSPGLSGFAGSARAAAPPSATPHTGPVGPCLDQYDPLGLALHGNIAGTESLIEPLGAAAPAPWVEHGGIDTYYAPTTLPMSMELGTGVACFSSSLLPPASSSSLSSSSLSSMANFGGNVGRPSAANSLSSQEILYPSIRGSLLSPLPASATAHHQNSVAAQSSGDFWGAPNAFGFLASDIPSCGTESGCNHAPAWTEVQQGHDMVAGGTMVGFGGAGLGIQEGENWDFGGAGLGVQEGGNQSFGSVDINGDGIQQVDVDRAMGWY